MHLRSVIVGGLVLALSTSAQSFQKSKLKIDPQVGLQGLTIPLENAGNFGVGFKTFSISDPWQKNSLLLSDPKFIPEFRRLVINVWYPSNVQHGSMVHADYFKPAGDYERLWLDAYRKWRNLAFAQETFFRMQMADHETVPQEDPEAYQRPTGATRDAPWAEGQFPMVFYHSSSEGGFEENAPIFEMFARNGIAVVTVLGDENGIIDASQRDFSKISQDMLIAFQELSREPHLNMRQIALMGFSIGAQSGLEIALKRMNASAIILLDTTLENQDFLNRKPRAADDILQAKSYFTPTLIIAGIAHHLLPPKGDRFRIYAPLRQATRIMIDYGDELEHNDFCWHGILERAAQGPFDPKKFDLATRRYAFNASLSLRFLKAALEQQPDWSGIEKLIDGNKTLWKYREVYQAPPQLLENRIIDELLNSGSNVESLGKILSSTDPRWVDSAIKNIRRTISSKKALEICEILPPSSNPDLVVCAAMALETEDYSLAEKYLKLFRDLDKKMTVKSDLHLLQKNDSKVLAEEIKRLKHK